MNSRVKKFIIIGIILVIIIGGFAYCQLTARTMPELNYPDATWEQLDGPKEGQEVAVVDTSMGTFKFALYRDNCPDTVDYFVNLVNDGFYDGKFVYAVSKDSYMMFGTTKSDGVIIKKDEVIKEGETDEKRKYTQEAYDIENKKNKNEINTKMWPFKGAVMSMGPDVKGTGAFICIFDSAEFTDRQIKDLKKGDKINKELVDKFIEVGGYPQYSQSYTYFGQVYEGMDVYENIINAKTKSKSTQPAKDIVINSIKIEKYAK